MLRFHLLDTVLDELQLVLIQIQSGADVLVAFDEFGGGEADRDAGGLGVVLDLVDHRVDAAVDRAGGAEKSYTVG